jgi:hypothetical protein
MSRPPERVLPILMPAIFPSNLTGDPAQDRVGRRNHPALRAIAAKLRDALPDQEARRKVLEYVWLPGGLGLDPAEGWPTLLHRCAEAPYGVEVLLSEIFRTRNYDVTLGQILDVVEEATGEPVVEPRDFDTLADLLAEVDIPTRVARQLYTETAGPDRRSLHRAITRPYDVLRELAFTPGTPSALVGYARRVARRPEADAVRTPLLYWTAKLEGDQETADAEPPRPRREPDAPPYLLVRLDPAGEDRGKDRYVLGAWVHRHGSAAEPLVDTDESLTLQDIPRRLDEIVRRAEDDAADVDLLAVEVFLPADLLSLDVDEWRLGHSGEEGMLAPIGTQYPLTVRSLDRAQRPYRRSWHLKWDHLAACPGGPECHVVRWADMPAPGENYYVKWNKKTAPSGIALGFRPDLAGAAGNALLAALYAGVPVALWNRRRDIGPAEFEYLVSSLFTRSPLRELPERVRTFRAEDAATPAADPPGRGLVLLFDDPRRLPPGLDRRYAAP